MKNILSLFIILLLSATIFAQDDQQMEEGAQESGDMQAWMDFMTPAEEHAELAKLVGDWKIKNTYWFSPGMEPQITEGTANAEIILGGRYLVTNHQGTVMGMPFQGMSIEAYDNALDKYVSIWLDNMGTGIAYAEGHYDDEIGGIVYEGTMTDPMTKADSWFKEIVKHNDGGMTMEMYMKAPDGSDFKNMEIEFTR